MKRREEREVARRLAGQPGGAPPADLLSRLKSDLPAAVAVGEEAAARRRPAALDRRWLVAASLAAMLGAGLLSLRVMERTQVRSPAREAPPVPGWSALAPRAAAPPAPRAAAGPSVSAPPPASALLMAEEVAPKAAPERDGAPGERRLDEVGRLRKSKDGKPAVAAPSSAAPKPAVPPPGVAGGFAAPPPVPAVPAIPAAPERATAEAELSTAYALEPLEAPQRDAHDSLQRAQAQGGRAKADAPAASGASGGAGAAGEVEDFASSYDTDAAADRAGWSLAAGGTPLPPPVAGHASRPAPGTRWVRFRLRAAAPARAGAVRVEIAWAPGTVARRRLGGPPAAATTAPDVFTLGPEALRRGWTAVYEVRFAPRFAPDTGTEPDERLATMRARPVDPEQGPAPRELSLAAADFAPSWMDAAPALRLSCLAAAFAERRLQAAGGDFADLLAAARSLAAETGDRRANDLVLRMLAAQRPSPAGPR